jgi:F-type H+-transporting ATPase subunit gamma
MSNPIEIRHRIAAVEQTRKITGAMEMVSSNRMRRVMGHIEYNRQYFEYIRKMMRELLSSTHDLSHRYLREREGGRRTYIVMSGDKGLCGSYNSAVLDYTDKRLAENPGSTLITIGNTAEDHYRRKGVIPDIAMLGIVQDPTMKSARRFSREVMRLYDEGLTDEIHVIYTSFYGETKNKPVEVRLLPVFIEDYEDVSIDETLTDMMFLTTPQAMFDQLVPQYILGMSFGMMVQAYASEHYSRMNAMHSSTSNAQDMLKSLTTQYNLARQSAITNEIAEITGASEILNGGGH